MDNISIFGTSSDAGKSTITWLIGKLLQEHGYTIAPFKAQNVSNNAVVADDLSEIAVAQAFQAGVLGVPSSWHLNPVLLKTGKEHTASLIIKGKALQDKNIRTYYRDIDTLKPIVAEAFEYLDSRYDCIIAEGAGSPVELNLIDKDLSNIFIADRYNTRIILVADIEKGGIFASVYGVYNLLPKHLRANVIGVIINKFRGDMSLFDEGVRIIEEEFGLAVLGVLPYVPFNLGFEDSQSIERYSQDCSQATERIAVIRYPTMSNYGDFEPLIANKSKCIDFISSNRNLRSYDQIILPGSKQVINDLNWLKDTGLFDTIQKIHTDTDIRITGICGGYEMMFEHLLDPEFIESDTAVATGLGFIDDKIVLERDKILAKDGHRYQIHHGKSDKYPDSYDNGRIYGTFWHGIFADEDFEAYSTQAIKDFIQTQRAHIDIERIIESVR